MSTELEQAIAAREALYKKIKDSGVPPHTDYWQQSLADADERVRQAQQKAGVDCYGLTPQERAELVKHVINPRGLSGVSYELSAKAWAACTKQRSAEIDTLREINNSLLTNVNQLKAELQQLRNAQPPAVRMASAEEVWERCIAKCKQVKDRLNGSGCLAQARVAEGLMQAMRSMRSKG